MSKHILFNLILLILILGIIKYGKDGKFKYNNRNKTLKSSQKISGSKAKEVNWMGCWYGLGKKGQFVREIATEFEFVTGIDVNLEFSYNLVGGENEELVGKYIADMIKNGDVRFDVVRMSNGIHRVVADELGDPDWAKKYLVDFEKIEGYKEAHKNYIVEDPIYRAQTGGVLTGPYIDGFYYALYYNSDVAERVGIDNIKRQGMTFDDLLRYVKRVYEYNQKNNTEIAAFFEAGDWITLENLFENLVKSEIGDFELAKEKKISERKLSALLKGFRAFEELGKYDPLISSYQDNIWAETTDIVFNDRLLFYVNATWMYSHWLPFSEEKVTKMVPVEMPSFREVDYYMGGVKSTWAVLKGAPNCEHGIELLMYICQPKIAEKWVRYTGSPTGIRGHLTTSHTGEDAFEQFQHIITAKYGKNIHRAFDAGYLLGKENRNINEDIKVKLIELLTNQLSAVEAYRDIVEKIK